MNLCQYVAYSIKMHNSFFFILYKIITKCYFKHYSKISKPPSKKKRKIFMILYNNIFESTIMVKKKRIFMNYNPIPKYFIA